MVPSPRGGHRGQRSGVLHAPGNRDAGTAPRRLGNLTSNVPIRTVLGTLPEQQRPVTRASPRIKGVTMTNVPLAAPTSARLFPDGWRHAGYEIARRVRGVRVDPAGIPARPEAPVTMPKMSSCMASRLPESRGIPLIKEHLSAAYPRIRQTRHAGNPSTLICSAKD